ncbi:hypothetical protein F5B21DRAFT_479425 [Xylaria acuta]|nr:hypothetical protein F5B21DRAFT_479425 [Xylaria acuta]
MSAMATGLVHYGHETQFREPRAEGATVEGYITVLILSGLAGFTLCLSMVALVILLSPRCARSGYPDDADLELGERRSRPKLDSAHSVPVATSNEELPARAAGSVHSDDSDDGWEEVELRGYQTARAVPITPVQREENPSADIPAAPTKKCVLRTIDVSSLKAPVVPATGIAKASRFVEHL